MIFKRVTYYKTLIWPKSTVERSHKTNNNNKKKKPQQSKKGVNKPPCFSILSFTILNLFCAFSSPFHKIKFYAEAKCKYENRNGCVFPVREINARTIEFKKRWHIYCNINVIYIVFFCWKRQKIFKLLLPLFSCLFFLGASTIKPFYLTQGQIFYQSTMETEELEEEVAVLVIWSSYEAFLKYSATSDSSAVFLRCHFCKFTVIMDRLWLITVLFYYLI